MQVDCENCSQSFEVDENQLPPEGMAVACTHCGGTVSIIVETEILMDEALADDFDDDFGDDVTKTLSYEELGNLPEALRSESPILTGGLPADFGSAADPVPLAKIESVSDGAVALEPLADDSEFDPAKGPLGTRIIEKPAELGLDPESTYKPKTLPIDRPKSTIAVIFNSIVVFGAMIGLTIAALWLANDSRPQSGIVSFSQEALSQAALGSLIIEKAEAVRYPTAHGEILLIYGTAKNTGTETVKNIYVQGKVTDASGRVIGKAQSIVGLGLTPFDLHTLTDQRSVKEAFRKAAGDNPDVLIEPGQSARFSTVMLNPPRHLGYLVPSIGLEVGEPLYVAAPKPVAEDKVEEDEGAARKNGKGKKRKRGAKQSRNL